MLVSKQGNAGRWWWAASSLLLLAGALFYGCSGNGVKAGDPNDTHFLATQSFVNGFMVPAVVENMATGVENQGGFVPPAESDFSGFLRAVPGRLERQPFSDYLSVLKHPSAPGTTDSGYANGWHYFVFDTSGTIDSSGTTGIVHISDSVQFRNNSGAQQTPDSTTNRLEIRFLGQASIQNGSESFGGQIRFGHVFQRNGSTLVVNGSENDSLILDSDSLDIIGTLAQTVTNVVFQKSSTDSARFDDCPAAGTVRVTGFITASGPLLPNGDPIVINFDVTLTFNGAGEVRVVVVDSGRRLRWEYSLTGICNGSV
jgi:hypothetical protein